MTSNGDTFSEISLRVEWQDMMDKVDDKTTEYIASFSCGPTLHVILRVYTQYKQGRIKDVPTYIISALKHKFKTNDYDKEKRYFEVNCSMPTAETTLVSRERDQSEQIAGGVLCRTMGMLKCHASLQGNTLQSCDIQPEDQEPDSNEWRRMQSPPTSPDTPVDLQYKHPRSSTSSSSSLLGHLSKRFRQSGGAVRSTDLHDLHLKPDKFPCRIIQTVQQQYFHAYVQTFKSQNHDHQAHVLYQESEGDGWQRMWYRATRTPKHQQPILKNLNSMPRVAGSLDDGAATDSCVLTFPISSQARI